MADWKKIRDEFNALANPNSPDVSQYAAMEYAADEFPSLISALEEQEKALDEFIKAWGVQIEDGYVTDGNGMPVPAGAVPKLAKYLEEKNG